MNIHAKHPISPTLDQAIDRAFEKAFGADVVKDGHLTLFQYRKRSFFKAGFLEGLEYANLSGSRGDALEAPQRGKLVLPI